jgi:hypothetical protein
VKLFARSAVLFLPSSEKGRALTSRMPRERIPTESDGPFAQVEGRPAFPWDTQQTDPGVSGNLDQHCPPQSLPSWIRLASNSQAARTIIGELFKKDGTWR